MTAEQMEQVLAMRVSSSDVHYAGGLVDGAYVMRIFGDALTFVALRDDGDESLLSTYEVVEFKEPVRPGDFLAVSCREVARTRLSRTFDLAATLQGRGRPLPDRASAGEAWNEPGKVVASARARVVVPLAAVRQPKKDA
ncbi:hotdog fold thioesterase [Janibacter melonis]|uniref:hotdog fold domain-containing protein n=1 Tax=Janibacter melonis TaxID=262209 RepID=UPI002043482E|nr:hotdog fold domain-containing protein [Janibacter melonis]MCM3556835.1 hotdog fold thioesterase [Janibacter melonis]